MGKFFAGAGGALIGGALSGISNLFGTAYFAWGTVYFAGGTAHFAGGNTFLGITLGITWG